MILVVNAGSSSLKLRLLDQHDAIAHSADLPADADGFDEGRLGEVIRSWPTPDAIGHRVVHGGPDRDGPVLLDPEVRAQLADLVDLAPLHQPKSLAALDAVTAQLPGTPAVACFDTAFHTTMPAEAFTYPIPLAWRQRYRIRRYGFHGLSHAYCARRVPVMLNRAAAGLRIVNCHLGAGASITAIADGRSVDTTMGFTPLDGIVMATRSGSIDPGLVLWLVQHAGLAPGEIADALETQSGVLALAGTPDMRAVVERADAQDPSATLAFQVYVHHLAAGIAAMTASLGGLDVLAFTGGVGENSSAVRSAAAARVRFLGVDIDESANAAAEPDADISASAARIQTVVVAAREDLEVAREVRQVVTAGRG